MNYTYIATIIVTSLAMIVLSIFTLKNGTLSRTAKIGITGCAIIIIVGALSECLGEIFERHDASFRAAHAAVKFIELCPSPLLRPLCLRPRFTARRQDGISTQSSR